jgi:hypothetical protein
VNKVEMLLLLPKFARPGRAAIGNLLTGRGYHLESFENVLGRRRGVQTALLSARLADAAAAGCGVTPEPPRGHDEIHLLKHFRDHRR